MYSKPRKMVERKRVCGLISGGKDSNYAFYKALMRGYEPVCILSIKPGRTDSWMFHVPHTSLVKYQAKAMGLEEIYYEFEVSGVKEEEVEELFNILLELKEKVGFDVISVGAIASRYQYDRMQKIAKKLRVEIYAPQWGEDPGRYMKRLVTEGFRFIITKISVYGLPPSYLGRIITGKDVDEIILLANKYGFNPAFEGGEAETFVVDAPHFKKRIILQGESKKMGPYEWQFDFKKIELREKGQA